MSAYQRILRTGQPIVDLEVRGFVPWDPSNERWWLVNHRPVSNGAGEIVGIITAVQDVTNLKRTEKELRDARDRLADAQRISQIGSFTRDPNSDEMW